MDHTLLEFLSSNPIFAAMPAKKRERIAAASRLCRYAADDFLWHEGDQTDDFALVVEGLLKSSIPLPAGESAVSEILQPGDLGGCRAYLRGGRALSSLRAVVDSAVLLVPVKEVSRDPWDKAQFYEAVAHSLERRYQRQLELRAISQEVSHRKIPAILLWLRRATGATIPLTQAVIAELVGVSGATLCRALAPLKKEGLVSVSRGVIKIRHPDELARVLRSA